MTTIIDGTLGITFSDNSNLATAPVSAVEWQTVKDANFNAIVGKAYPVNTTSGPITVTLPSSVTAGQQIIFTDYAGTWGTYNLILQPNGNKIQGSTALHVVNTNKSTIALVYVDNTQGWISSSNTTTLEFYQLEIFAWGGGGGGGYSAGTGGGGGAAYCSMNILPNSSLAVVVGGRGLSMAPNAGAGAAVSGGGGLAGNLGYGGQGGGYSGIFLTSTTQANAVLIAGGGGGGAYEGAAGGAGGGTSGVAGGSGALAGGGGGTQSAGGTSVSQAGSALQGGSSGGEGDSGGSGGGGGGYWGGGAGSNNNPGSAGGGGSGYYNPLLVTTATLYTGSGTTPGDASNSLRGSYGNGGAAGNNAGTQGVVIIRYLGAQRGNGGTITSSGGYTYHTFTTAGTFTS